MSWEYALLFMALALLIMGVMKQFINFSKHRKRVDNFDVFKGPLIVAQFVRD